MALAWLVCAPSPMALLGPVSVRAAQLPGSTADTTGESGKTSDESGKKSKRGDVLADTPDMDTQLEQLRFAAMRLPIAAGLASILALRPRRRGTPPRQPPVIQTQIILAIVGAMVMLVVGSSLARAFGIVGAAGLVRYRAKIEDPKDAGVMLSTLAIGLASGVGLWPLAGFSTVFVLIVLWVIESFEPRATKLFSLTVKGKDPASFKAKVEAILSRRGIQHELRTTSQEEICYDVRVPLGIHTEAVSDQIAALDPETSNAVQWEEKKEKK